MSIFSDLAAKTNLPGAALEPILKALENAFNLTLENNERVAKVQASKAKDKNDHDYIDSLWRTHAPLDPEMREVEEEYQAVNEKMMELQDKLRAFALTKVPEELSEEAAKNMRQLVNSGKEAVETARKQAENMASVIDPVLNLVGENVEGGIMSLMPPLESLKQTRGRKAGSTIAPGGYMTKVQEIFIDGVSTNNAEGKGKFNYAADALSKQWGAEEFGGNRVTPEELEIAYLNKHGYESRVAKKDDKEAKLPTESEFEFTKTIEVPSKNDDSTTTVTKKVTVKVVREVKGETSTPATNAAIETPATNTTATETTPVETPKVETSAPEVKTPAKKTAAPAKK